MALYERPLAGGGELLVERLAVHKQATGQDLEFDVVIVGSGYGGSVAAARLTEDIRGASGKLSVCLLERGLEHLPGAFPARFADLPRHVRINRFDAPELTGDAAGLFDVRIGKDVSVLVGNGLGGGSLINAGVAERPDPAVFDARWPGALQNPEALSEYFDAASAMLGAGPAKVEGLAKYREFKAWAQALGIPARPAKVAVTFRDASDNGHGVEQNACINCGDCFTGCNYHAKNTLPMNYLARAARNGACLYTGVTVSRVAPAAGAGWSVCFSLTPRPGAASWRREEHCVHAGSVILAAGALGSTEILKRSQSAELRFSGALGARFSCNGDMISALYGQDNAVNAAPREDAPACARNVGPTITGIARKNGLAADRVVLEELAIPGALRRVFEEVATAGALPYRVAGFDSWPASAADPLAVDPDAVDRTQVFAAMGEDAATGELEMIPGWNDAANPKVADGVMTVKWPQAASDPIYERQDQTMEHGITRGGEYLRSPLWQPLPKEMSDALGGLKPGGRVLTVHPLGGCPMADDVKSGVVNHLGQVFRAAPAKEDVYPDLLVLDGSIVPVALGINPLLTITALAERAIRHYVADNVKRGIWQLGPEHRIAQPHPVWAPAPAHATTQRAAETPVPTGLRFAERVQGDLTLGSIHEAKLTLHFEAVENVPGFLRDGARKLRIESGELQATPQGTKRTRSAKVHGNVVLLERCDERPFTRTLIALWAFLWKRGIADWLQTRREKRVARGGSPTSLWDLVWGCVLLLATPLLAILGGLAAEIGCVFWPRWQRTRRSNPARAKALITWIRKWAPWLAMIPLAYQTGEARRLCYRLTLEEDLELKDGRLPKGTRIEGRKILRYKLWGNPWWQLFELPVSIKAPEDWFATRGSLNVDLEYFFRRYATQLQLTQQRDLPSGLTDLASTVLFLLRAVGKVHFWSFRLPEYQKHDPKLKEHRTPGALRGLEWEPVDIPRQGDLPPVLVTHYWKKDKPGGKPVVLFHGLGASGNQFATAKLDTNLVQHLAEQGRDVWVAELRHSIALDSSLEQWTLDQIALGDVPRIVAKVLERTRHPRVDVVAHCIGSAMFCIAALAGKLQRNGASMIDAAVLMQVGPLITLSDGTRIRAYLAAFLRRYLMESFVDFSIDDRADWLDSLVDRVLVTYPYPASEARHHYLVPPWKPQLHLANCNRWAAIDGRMLQHENLDERMLHSLGEILGHSNITTWEQTIQYAYLERLTDHEACNSYVTEKNIRAYFGFPVRFIHGAENDVFLVKTSERSCQLLKQVWGDNHPCDVRKIKGYSHLDPLIGKNACRDVYPEISEFLSEQRVIKPLHRPAPPEMRRPLIGPIVGWTRKNAQGLWTVRVWCRVDDTRSPCSYVIAVPRKNGTTMAGKWKAVDPRPGRVDTLAVFDVELDADNADYEIIVMSVHLSAAQPNPKKPKGDWAGFASPEVDVDDAELRKRVAEVERLAPRLKDRCTTDPHYDEPLDRAIIKRAVLEQISGSEATRFAFASCRYGASVIDRERADATFGALSTLVESADAAATPCLLLLAGDQIYADQTAGVFDPRGRRERFYEAYREAWTAPHARAVFSRLPTYMMMDDHEVSDNWHPKDLQIPAGEARLRKEGLEAFQEYQLLHSPRHRDLSKARLLSAYPAEGFGYEFSAAGFPFFVFDTRTGRERKDYIMQNQQMQNFGAWLDRCGPDDDRPKFVVSSSIVLPYRRASGPERSYASRSDGWDGYPESMKELFAAIWSRRARNVVFLCGDAHFSIASRIRFVDSTMQSQDGLHAYCVVSSGLYAPFPFANSRRSDYLEANGSRLLPVDAAAGVFMHYQTLPESYLDTDNFTLIEVAKSQERWRINLRHHTASGPGRTIELNSTVPPLLEMPASAMVK